MATWFTLLEMVVSSGQRKIILEPGGNGHVKSAYACVAGNAVFYKFVNGNEIVNA